MNGEWDQDGILQPNSLSNTDYTCGERVKYLVKRYHISENDAMIALVKEKNCICNAVNDDEKSIRALERITGDHIDTYVSLSLELDELFHGELVVLPGFLPVDVHSVTAGAPVSAKSTFNDDEEERYDVDALPCCEDVISSGVPIDLAVEMEGGGAINVDDWQIIKGETIDSSDVYDLENDEDGTIPFSDWIAIEPIIQKGNAIKFFEDGWILTKEQLLRLDSGNNNRGKFLPPFRDDNAPFFRNNGPTSLASPLFETKEKGGLGIRRAINLDPHQFSGQLIHCQDSRSGSISESKSLGVKELLLQFHNAKKIDTE